MSSSSSTKTDEALEGARKLFRSRKYEEAIAAFQQILAKDDARADAHEGIANAYFAAQQLDKAIEHFQRHTALDPRQGRSLVNTGAIYNRTEQFQKAVDVLRKGIMREKKSPFGYYNLGLAYRGLKQYAMAVSAYREALKIDSEFAEAHQNLANVLMEMGSNQPAIMHYRKALEIRPDFKRAAAGLARAEGRAADAKKAIKPFGRLVDEATYKRPAGNTFSRALSEVERAEDRETVYTLAQQIETAAVTLLHQLRNDFEPHLVALSRSVSQGDEAPAIVTKAHELFQHSLDEVIRLRKEFKRRVLELRAHEEMLYSPAINEPDQAPKRR